MQIVWLGQGGLMLVSNKNKILIDPYMTNSLRKIDKSLKRRVKIKKKYFRLKPDIIILTNSHPDHTDTHTLVKFLKKKKKRIIVLSCENSFKTVADARGCKKANHIMFGEGDEWTFDNLHILAVKARTDDRSAFGLLITDSTDGKKYYISSNTLYNEEIINSLPKDIHAAFLPISGDYGCMNMVDAQRFAKKLDAEFVVPINYGMFDKIDPDEFKCAGKIIPNPFRAIEFNILALQSLFAPRVFDRNFNEKTHKDENEALSSEEETENEEKKNKKVKKEKPEKKKKVKKEKKKNSGEENEEATIVTDDDYIPAEQEE